MLKDIDDDLLCCFSKNELEEVHLHHEGNKGYAERFRKDVTQLYEELKICGNLFIEDGEELEKINGKCISSPASSASVRNALNI